MLSLSEIDGAPPREEGESNEKVLKSGMTASIEENGTNSSTNCNNSHVGQGLDEIPERLRHQLKHRELFLSRQVETLPATHIRGKCCVTLLNETESLLSYLNKEVSITCHILIWKAHLLFF